MAFIGGESTIMPVGNTAIQLSSLTSNPKALIGGAVAAYCLFGKMPRKLRHFKLPLLATGLYMSGLPQMLAAKVSPMLPSQIGGILSNPLVSTAAVTMLAQMVFSKNTYRRAKGGARRLYSASRRSYGYARKFGGYAKRKYSSYRRR